MYLFYYNYKFDFSGEVWPAHNSVSEWVSCRGVSVQPSFCLQVKGLAHARTHAARAHTHRRARTFLKKHSIKSPSAQWSMSEWPARAFATDCWSDLSVWRSVKYQRVVTYSHFTQRRRTGRPLRDAYTSLVLPLVMPKFCDRHQSWSLTKSWFIWLLLVA